MDLLIISCSKTKKDLQNTPAIELYDGPVYRMLRNRSKRPLDIKIISAKYGLIDSEDHISNYDQVMTFKRAFELQHHISEEILQLVLHNSYRQIFVNLGEIYMLALDRTTIRFLDEHRNTIFASGPIGKRLHQLKEWLEAEA